MFGNTKVKTTVITIRDLYSVLTQLVIHAESISWNRLYNFLTCNSILVLAWATAYVSQAPNPDCKIVLVAFCILGAASGIVWAELGKRGRAYLDHYRDQAKDLEKQPNAFSPDIPKDFWPFQSDVKGSCQENLKVSPPGKMGEQKQASACSPPCRYFEILLGPYYGTSRRILKVVPYLFTALYCLLFVLSIRRT